MFTMSTNWKVVWLLGNFLLINLSYYLSCAFFIVNRKDTKMEKKLKTLMTTDNLPLFKEQMSDAFG